jgi:hypothetical protein
MTELSAFELSAFAFQRSPWAVQAARREVRSLSDLPRAKRGEIELVVSELVSATLLGEGRGTDLIEITVQREPERVLVEVTDRSAKATSLPAGLGAQLLDSLCESWRPSDGSVAASSVIASIPLDHIHASAARRHGRSRPGGAGPLLFEARALDRRSILRPAPTRR